MSSSEESEITKETLSVMNFKECTQSGGGSLRVRACIYTECEESYYNTVHIFHTTTLQEILYIR